MFINYRLKFINLVSFIMNVIREREDNFFVVFLNQDVEAARNYYRLVT